ncbi:MAG: hypothetical protein HYX73_10415 [Acidobacteria bacterium]|nr:hypothetical protein [Acidobacteriota bacterium]
MLRKLGAAIYRGLFWTYERGTWQYDIMVALILAFIFLTPRDWFNDQPNPPETAGVVLISSNELERVYQLRAALLQLKPDHKSEDAIRKGVERVLQSHTGKPVQITRIKPEMDAHGEVVSYAVWVQD